MYYPNNCHYRNQHLWSFSWKVQNTKANPLRIHIKMAMSIWKNVVDYFYLGTFPGHRTHYSLYVTISLLMTFKRSTPLFIRCYTLLNFKKNMQYEKYLHGKLKVRLTRRKLLFKMVKIFSVCYTGHSKK